MENTRLVAVWTACLLALSACGGGGGGGGGDAAAPPPTAPSANNAPTASSDPLVVGTSGSTISLSVQASDPDGDTLTYSWTQTRGTAVESRQGFDASAMSFQPAVGAVSPVETLSFDVQVSDGSASATASVDVVVAKDATRTAFVDGSNGSDETGDGSIAAPFATIHQAIEANGSTDIYVMALPDDAAYDETANTLRLDNGRSLFGGFDENWVRDVVGDKSIILTSHFGINFRSVAQPAEISGVEIRASAPTQNDLSARTPFLPVRALFAQGGSATLVIKHNVLIAEDASDAGTGNGNFGGSSIALKVASLPSVEISDNVVIAGNGAPGLKGQQRGTYISSPPPQGGDGGNGGTGLNENGDDGSNGGLANTSIGCGSGGPGGSGNTADDGSNGANGCGGQDGQDGIGGSGYGGYSTSSTRSGFVLAISSDGSNGTHGGGGGGGGGGEATSTGVNGGRGGDGGTGGRGALGTSGAQAGGASIGIELIEVAMAAVNDNEITTGIGGTGGEQSDLNPGEAGKFGFGGNSGNGSLLPGGDGGDGGRGGTGGDGGTGGSGAGGPSFAIYLGNGTTPTISGNTLQTGGGGERGLRGRQAVPTPAWHGRDGWSVGIFSWSCDLDQSGIGANEILLGRAFRAGVAAEFSDRGNDC